MRDIGFFVWVVLLIVGVIGSMASSARKQAARTQSPPDPSAGRRRVVQVVQTAGTGQGLAQPANVPPRPVAAPPPRPPQPVPPSVHQLEVVHARPNRGFFGAGPDLVRAVIAAEVLGKPRALRDE